VHAIKAFAALRWLNSRTAAVRQVPRHSHLLIKDCSGKGTAGPGYPEKRQMEI